MTFSNISDIASLASFALTVWVLWDVRRIRKSYSFAARIPTLAVKLRHHAATLSQYLNDFESFRSQVPEELARTEVTLLSLRRRLSGPQRSFAVSALRKVRRYRADDHDGADVRAIYLSLTQLEEGVKELREDLKWER